MGEGLVVREVRSDLGPDHVARHQGADFEGRPQGLARGRPEDRIGAEDVEKHRGVYRCLQGRFGRGPRIWSSNVSTGRRSFSRPYTLSTGWVPRVVFRIMAPPSSSSNRTAVPGSRPNVSRISTGTVIWPLDEILLFTR